MERDEGGGAPLSPSAEAVLAAVQRSADAVRDEMEALIEEQNVLAHMFVASDRLARARSPREARPSKRFSTARTVPCTI